MDFVDPSVRAVYEILDLIGVVLYGMIGAMIARSRNLDVIGVVFLPQILSLGLLSGALKLGAAAAETFSESRPAEVMKSAAGAVSIMLSIVICYAVMLLGALAMVLLARS